MTARLEHFEGCPNPNPQPWTGRNGDRMQTCGTCGFVTLAPPDEQEPQELTSGRYFLACIRCDGPIWLDRPGPRVPLCEACKHKPKPRRWRRDRVPEGELL